MADTTTKTTNPAAVAEPSESQALEKADVKVPEIITTPDQFTSALANWSSRFNVLTPFAAISGIAVQHGIVRSVVQMDLRAQYAGESTEHGGDLYGGTPWLKGGRRGEDDELLAPTRKGLRKIADCAGISYTTQRVDPYTIPLYWMFKAVGSFRGVDGSVITREATMEWDLRDGSERINGWKADQIKEGRKNGLRNCETRAINALIRDCCGLKQAYTRRELKKPFLVVRVVFMPNMNDPEQRRMVTEAGLRSTSLLYGAPPHSLPAPVVDEVDEFAGANHEPRHVGSGTAESSKAEEKPDAAPSADAVRVVKVEVKDGETKGRKWRRYTVADNRGEECSTFDKAVADAADRARESKAWVELVCETNGGYRNLIEIIPAGSEPKLPTLENL